jgi:hypothetical protein
LGKTDTALGLTNMTLTPNFIPSSFPSVADGGTKGMGDYQSATKRGTLDGLVPVWGQAIQTIDTTNGIHCTWGSGNHWYTVGVMGALVQP